PRVLAAPGRRPCPPLVGQLLGDLRVELALHAVDVRLPVGGGGVELADLAHAGHEARELLELGPLVVRGAYRHVYVNELGHGTHGVSLLVVVSRRLMACHTSVTVRNVVSSGRPLRASRTSSGAARSPA